MNKQSFILATKYLTTESFCINLAPAVYIRTNMQSLITDKEYIIVRDIEHNNQVNVIPYNSILYIHE